MGTMLFVSYLFPVATHQVPLITVMKRSFGLKVRPAEVARLEPVHDHVQPGFFRIAYEDRLVHAGCAGRVAPLELVGAL